MGTDQSNIWQKPMNTAVTDGRPSPSTILIVALLVANLGMTTYIAFRPFLAPAAETSKDEATSAVSSAEANKLVNAIIPLYNAKDVSGLYDRFDPLAKVQFTKEQFVTQMAKLGAVIGKIEGFAYSHTTVAGVQGGRTYYTLHFKVSLSGGPFQTGDMTITSTRNADGLSLFGFFINGTSNQPGQ